LLAERARVLSDIAYTEDELKALQKQSSDERQDERRPADAPPLLVGGTAAGRAIAHLTTGASSNVW